MTDNMKIYDMNWAENCTQNKYTANAIYGGEYYACPESAAREGGYDIDYCKKIPDDACIYTYTDGFSLVGKNAFEKPWTSITSMFMHADINHLLGNMLFLFILGGIVEGAIGMRKSGAIFGILGAAAILRPMQTVYVYFLPMPLIVIGLIYIGLQVYYIFMGGEAGVANGAHLGGAIIGIIAAIYLRKKVMADEF
ncbi:MAG: hypothetical protein CVT89_02960 [Candidatus Altiarchaeales archaeon HGW-Altiarchaeales-2]|nr:MAG: hypothetical protein CVT89_02960 [Candidatus Altiarchaeales archaeon HGW-Altiarchaeales-2]